LEVAKKRHPGGSKEGKTQGPLIISKGGLFKSASGGGTEKGPKGSLRRELSLSSDWGIEVQKIQREKDSCTHKISIWKSAGKSWLKGKKKGRPARQKKKEDWEEILLQKIRISRKGYIRTGEVHTVDD